MKSDDKEPKKRGGLITGKSVPDHVSPAILSPGEFQITDHETGEVIHRGSVNDVKMYPPGSDLKIFDNFTAPIKSETVTLRTNKLTAPYISPPTPFIKILDSEGREVTCAIQRRHLAYQLISKLNDSATLFHRIFMEKHLEKYLREEKYP